MRYRATQETERRFRAIMESNGLWEVAQQMPPYERQSYLRGARQVFDKQLKKRGG